MQILNYILNKILKFWIFIKSIDSPFLAIYLLIFSISGFIFFRRDYFILLRSNYSNTLLLLLPFFFLFVLIGTFKIIKTDHLLLIASMVIVVLFFLFQNILTDQVTGLSVAATNTYNCNILKNLKSADIKNNTRIFWPHFYDNTYKDNLGFIYKTFGNAAGDNFINIIADMDSINGVIDTVQSLNIVIINSPNPQNVANNIIMYNDEIINKTEKLNKLMCNI